MSAVIADVTTNYAVDETMMLFPDKNKKSRQMRLYEQLNLKDSMPLVSVDTEIFSHECALFPIDMFDSCDCHYQLTSMLRASV